MNKNKLSINKNKGMFLEELINRSCNYLWNQKIGFISKRFTKVHISKVEGNKVSGFLASKNYVDYTGIIQQHHFEFEAKMTKQNKFYFTNIKKSQLTFLQEMKKLNARTFFIIYFHSKDIIVKIDSSKIHEMISNNKKFISWKEGVKKGKELKVLYPGIIQFWK